MPTKKTKKDESVKPGPEGCPHHARSIMLCSCRVVPASNGITPKILTAEQYKHWKTLHKKKRAHR